MPKTKNSSEKVVPIITVVFPQNHIQQNILDSLNSIQFLSANMFQPENQF